MRRMLLTGLLLALPSSVAWAQTTDQTPSNKVKLSLKPAAEKQPPTPAVLRSAFRRTDFVFGTHSPSVPNNFLFTNPLGTVPTDLEINVGFLRIQSRLRSRMAGQDHYFPQWERPRICLRNICPKLKIGRDRIT